MAAAGVALGGLYGFAASSLYAGAKFNAAILTDFEYAARNRYGSLQNYYIGLMSGY